ncbi:MULTISPECIES: MCR_0457 family protein [unclassified Moraxella]|uniref:MCR_0457 family protein n=1 Tax=unclassified Moraxella TaxID=2685852 RepID=UPI00359DAC75
MTNFDMTNFDITHKATIFSIWFFDTHLDKTIKIATHLPLLTALLCVCIAHANPDYTSPMRGKIYKTSSTTFTVSEYELALVQVLSEICPPMLNNNQRVRFARAYNQQLRSFMPTSANPNDTLRHLHTQRDYRAALQSVRAWTTSYPAAQNRRLCLQFAEVEF